MVPTKLIPLMQAKFARACGVAIGLMLAIVNAAEPPSPLIGVTRDQLLVRYGEPRSQIEQGNLVVYFYPRERVVLRNNVVIEVEQLSAEPVRRPPAAETTAPDAGRAESSPAAKDAAPGTAATPGAGAGTDLAAPGAATQSPAPEPKFEIKLVRPPGSPPLPEARTPPGSSAASTSSPASPPQNESPTPVLTPTAEPPPARRVPTPASTVAAEAARAKEQAAAKAEEERRATLEKARKRLDEAALKDSMDDGVGMPALLIGGAVLLAGAGFWLWRRKRADIEPIASSSAEAAPAPAAAAPVALAAKPNADHQISEDLLGSLDSNRFEELVAAYYSKTGVVAVRTHTGPQTPVHVRISWKGEPRPFACVHCIARPSGPVDAKPLQEFAAVLATEDIRRGYVVTSGRFGEAARAVAEEKHLTLMPGELLREKLNALPATARAEIMRSVGIVR
jgi:LPXTG-motif cell wall-anchored protein